MSDLLIAYNRAVALVDPFIQRAADVGITAEAVTFLHDAGDLLDDESDGIVAERWTAASINKLAVALWLLRARPNTRPKFLEWDEGDRRAGGGRFDQPDAPCRGTLRELMFDMLSRSSNTAMAILGYRNLASIRLELIGNEIDDTGLVPVGTEGRFETGYTTPRGALLMLDCIMNADQTDPLAQTMQNALSQGETFLRLRDVNGHWRKCGQLNGPDNDGEFIRHEVGIVEGCDGTRVGYAVFTSYRGGPVVGRIRTLLAERLIARVGGMLAEVVGSQVALRSRVFRRTVT